MSTMRRAMALMLTAAAAAVLVLLGSAPASAAPRPAPDGPAASHADKTGATTQADTNGQTNTDAATDSNRGSVKVRAVGSSTFPPSNEPHLPCVFEIHLYGFSAGTADVRIDVHAPTGSGTVYTNQVALSEARGNDVSAVLGPVDLTDALVGNYTPQPNQGFHVKLFVDRVGSNGGAKQKVFWVDCGASEVAPETVETVTAAGQEGQVLGLAEQNGSVAAAGEAVPSPQAAPTGQVEAAAAARPASGGTLPFTGSHLLELIGAGIAAIAAGMAFLSVRRPGARPNARSRA